MERDGFDDISEAVSMSAWVVKGRAPTPAEDWRIVQKCKRGEGCASGFLPDSCVIIVCLEGGKQGKL